jgi:DNA-binding phage protein
MEAHELTTRRAEITAKLKADQSSLAKMERELASIPSTSRYLSGRSGAETYSSEDSRRSGLRQEISSRRARVEAMEDELRQLDKTSAYRDRIETAIPRAQDAREAMHGAQMRYSELTNRAGRLREKITEIRAASLVDEERARQAESAAARDFAAAIADGDAVTEKKALASLAKARESNALSRAKANDDEHFVYTLEQQAAAIESEAATAAELAREHRSAMYEAISDSLASEWDSVVAVLASVGARLSAVRFAGGRAFPELWQLHVPRFEPGQTFLAERDLSRGASGIDAGAILDELLSDAEDAPQEGRQDVPEELALEGGAA